MFQILYLFLRMKMYLGMTGRAGENVGNAGESHQLLGGGGTDNTGTARPPIWITRLPWNEFRHLFFSCSITAAAAKVAKIANAEDL